MKILFIKIGTPDGVVYQMENNEDSLEFFEAVLSIQKKYPDIFNGKKYRDNSSVKYILLESKESDTFNLFWKEINNNAIEKYSLDIKKSLFEEYFETTIDIVVIPAD